MKVNQQQTKGNMNPKIEQAVNESKKNNGKNVNVYGLTLAEIDEADKAWYGKGIALTRGTDKSLYAGPVVQFEADQGKWSVTLIAPKNVARNLGGRKF